MDARGVHRNTASGSDGFAEESRPSGLRFEGLRVRSDLSHAQQLTGSAEALPESVSAGFVDGPYLASTIRRDDGQEFVGGEVLVVEKFRAVGRNDHLSILGSVSQSIEERAERRRMKRNLRLFDSDEMRIVRGVRALEESGQHAESSQGAVRHAHRVKAPWMRGSVHALDELEAFFRTESPGVYADDLGDRSQIPFDRPLVSGRAHCQLQQDTRDVSAVALEEISHIRQSEASHGVRIQVVEAHARETVVHRSEDIDARRPHEIELVRNRCGRSVDVARSDDAVLERVVADCAIGLFDGAFFPPNSITAISSRRDLDTEVSAVIAQVEFEPNSEAGRMTVRPPSDLVDPASSPYRVVHGVP